MNRLQRLDEKALLIFENSSSIIELPNVLPHYFI